MEQQLKAYVNRYGHGLVIYWYGFVANLRWVDNIHVVDRFPDCWEFPNGKYSKENFGDKSTKRRIFIE